MPSAANANRGTFLWIRGLYDDMLEKSLRHRFRNNMH